MSMSRRICSWIQSLSVLGSTRKLARNKDQNPAACSQDRNEDNPRQGGCWKQQRGDACDSSGGCWKLQRGVENQLERTRLDYHNVQISDYRYVEKVFENLRQKLRSFSLDAKTNVLIWGLFMSTTMKSSVHLGLQYQENLVAYRNTNFEELKTLCDITLRLIVEQSFEILNVSTMKNTFFPWMRSSLCHDQAIKYVHSDSVLCLGKISEANGMRKSQISEFQQSNEYTELSGIDGESIGSKWNIFVFQGTSALNRGILSSKGGRNTILCKSAQYYGAVSSWCEELAEKMLGQTSLGVDNSISKVNDQLSKQLDPQDIGSVVQNQPRTEEAAGNCWRDHLQRFKMLDQDEQFRTICDLAGFTRPVSVGMYYRTSDDVNDEFGNLTASRRKYTLLRARQDSVVKLWIQRHREIGPVRNSDLLYTWR